MRGFVLRVFLAVFALMSVRHFVRSFGVYVVFHSTLLSIPQLRKLVEDTLPSSVPFFVGICSEYDHVPSREVPEENKTSDPA